MLRYGFLPDDGSIITTETYGLWKWWSHQNNDWDQPKVGIAGTWFLATCTYYFHSGESITIVSRHPLQDSLPPPFPMSHSVSKYGHSSSRSINFAVVNINSVTGTERLQELNHFVELIEIDILAVSEMKIDSTVHPILYALHGFTRAIVNYRTRKGGCTAIYVRNNIAFSHLPELESSDFESS